MNRYAFRLKLHELGFNSYAEYLASDHWKDVRRRYFESKLYKGQCFACAARNVPMHLHHRTYKRIGAEFLNDFIAICSDCHEAIHKIEKEHGDQLWKATRSFVRRTWMEKGSRPNGLGPTSTRYLRTIKHLRTRSINHS